MATAASTRKRPARTNTRLITPATSSKLVPRPASLVLQHQHQQQQQLLRSPQTIRSLRRDILDATVAGQNRTDATQAELDRQADKIRESLDIAKNAATQGANAEVRANELAQALKTPNRFVLRELASRWCCCKGPATTKTNVVDANVPVSPVSPDSSHANTDVTAEDEDSAAIDDANDDKQKTKRRAWKRTIAPSIDELIAASGDKASSASAVPSDVWLRQMDASLTRLQDTAKQMGASLDEQIQQANMLEAYLNYGVERTMAANEALNTR